MTDVLNKDTSELSTQPPTDLQVQDGENAETHLLSNLDLWEDLGRQRNPKNLN